MFVAISCICYTSDLQVCDLLWANYVVHCCLCSLLTLHFFVSRIGLVMPNIMMSGLISRRSSGAVLPSESLVLSLYSPFQCSPEMVMSCASQERQTYTESSHPLHTLFENKVCRENIVATCALALRINLPASLCCLIQLFTIS